MGGWAGRGGGGVPTLVVSFATANKQVAIGLHKHRRLTKHLTPLLGQDDTRAFKYAELAAKQGQAGSQFNVGVSYQNGLGVEQVHTRYLPTHRSLS